MDVDPSAVTAALPDSGQSDQAKSTAQPNDTVGKYRLDRQLGAGGMGVVWAAFDPDLERAVALKLLRAETAEVTMRTRLLREARAMARLRHPNVVTVFDVGTDKGRDYIAMELVEGGTLDDWLQTRPPREQIVDALLAAGRGLAAAHAAGLVHRDFKPHNVLRGADGHIYVTDFGLAKGQIDDGPEPVLSSGDNVLESHLTQTGVFLGTPAYMAPEQFTGAMPDPKSDQFAFCVTAWQALTGTRPFRGSSVEELAESARAGVAKLAADLPQPMRAVLERGLASSPDDRWPGMGVLLDAFAAAARRPRKRRWLVPALAGAALVAGGTVFTIAMLQNDGEEELCGPADKTFDEVAWRPEIKRRIQDEGMSSLGVIAIVEETRRRWIASYTEACKAERTPAVEERLHCLLSVRDDIGSRLAAYDGDKDGMAQVAGATVRMIACDPETLLDRRRDRRFRVPPVPPMPPRVNVEVDEDPDPDPEIPERPEDEHEAE